VASLVMIDDTNVEITRMLHLLFEAEDVRVSVTMDDAEGIRKAQELKSNHSLVLRVAEADWPGSCSTAHCILPPNNTT